MDAVDFWCHHNRASSWGGSLTQQGLEALIRDADDPLRQRTFGGIIRGRNLVRSAADTLTSARPDAAFSMSVALLTQRAESPAAWLAAAQRLTPTVPMAEDNSAWQARTAWWTAFWNRSHIDMGGGDDARTVATGYALQRFITACAGRGEFPIKFNGSLFTADWHAPGEDFDADYRRWGPGYCLSCYRITAADVKR